MYIINTMKQTNLYIKENLHILEDPVIYERLLLLKIGKSLNVL